MTTYMTPYTHLVNLQDGTIPTAPLVQQRRLSDMRGLFADPAAEYALMGANPLIYEVYEAAQNPKETGHLLYSTTVIHPGKVGDEYFMTKGHYHQVLETSEVYYCLKGQGFMVMETPEGEWAVEELHPGRVLYVLGYARAAEKRGLGFAIALLASVVLLLGALIAWFMVS